MLYRDESVTLDVWLQSGRPGISQESHQLLFDFPETPEALFEYDCLVAFDVDWTELDVLQVKSLEQWVGEKAGGLIVVAGPVYTPQWADVRRGDSRLETIRALYPVVLYSSGAATLGLGRFGGERPWPLAVHARGRGGRVPAAGGRRRWRARPPGRAFDGVYGYYAVKDPKPGARVYARFSDPEHGDRRPAADLPGRAVLRGRAGVLPGQRRDVAAAGGRRRLLRTLLHQADPLGLARPAGSRLEPGRAAGRQGPLPAGRYRGGPGGADRCPEPAAVGARGDGQPGAAGRQPDDAGAAGRQGSGPRRLVSPASSPAALEGDYRVELKPPHGEVDQLLVREVRVRVEDIEVARPERNDPLLLDLAPHHRRQRTTSGWTRRSGPGAGPAPLASALLPQDQVTVPGRHARPGFRPAVDGLADGADLRGAGPGMAAPAVEPAGVR